MILQSGYTHRLVFDCRRRAERFKPERGFHNPAIRYRFCRKNSAALNAAQQGLAAVKGKREPGEKRWFLFVMNSPYRYIGPLKDDLPLRLG